MSKTETSPPPTPTSNNLSRFLNVYLLLIFFPVALIARLTNGSPVIVFVGSALAIIPLAAIIGHATEAVAAKLGPGLGGLINATLGNAAELIITIFALRAGFLDLVKASLIGSVLGNLLLIMGFSFLIGGIRHGIQTFNKRTAGVNSTLVILAFVALAVPSAFHEPLLKASGAVTGGQTRELLFSEGIALIMIVLYGLYLLFSLRSSQNVEKVLEEAAHETHADQMSMRRAVGLLALATVGIVIMSETLVGTVEPVGRSLGLSEFFIGIIIVPLVGNVAEHVVAIQVAAKNRMDLSMGISLGSSLQIALFVAPVLVFVSLLFEKKLILAFNLPEVIGLATASIVAALVSQDGESNWLEGAILLAVYVLLAMAYFLVPVEITGIAH